MLRGILLPTSVIGLALSAVAQQGSQYILAVQDSCAEIAGKRWVLPSEARACLTSFPVDPVIKSNLIEVVNKTLAFHTSANYQIQAPHPYQSDVHEDLLADLARISQKDYASEFDLHLDFYRSFKRVNDGHCGVYNYCYDGLYVTYLPLPLVLLTEKDGTQNVHIAPEAFSVASAEFKEELEFWQNALPGHLKGALSTLSGARVFLIDGEDPFKAVNRSALLSGGYQAFGTRQNAFFASYQRGSKEWSYLMGNFASMPHPLIDAVKLTVQRVDHGYNDTFVVPYRSRFGSASKNFTDLASYRKNNCIAQNTTNGYDLYEAGTLSAFESGVSPVTHFQQQPYISQRDARRQPVNVILDGTPLSNVELPQELQPSLTPLNQSYSVAQFYMLNDTLTSVLALGSFSAANFTEFGSSLLNGLQGLIKLGAKNLIVDVTNNGGGYICIAHWLHRIIIGPKDTTEPQAGLDTTLRAGPLAQLIVEKISQGADPDGLSSYNPLQWRNATHVTFPPKSDWLNPKETIINGHLDAFSQRLGQECQPFEWEPPEVALFDPKNVIIISNGRCASSCSLFSITMAKEDGVRTVVVGGRRDVPQHYCGTVGGQSTGFSSIDTEIKTMKLKNHSLAPPNFLTNSVQGITWRLGFGIDKPHEPEEWQDHTADFTFPLTKDNVNNPVAIWDVIAEQFF
ncbi:hypothetical protein AX15_006802 [Amanita polypyramis BW_CC]|nr:hypothetical protein AX15_006802 [Amanita polypyramis BW_CC]